MDRNEPGKKQISHDPVLSRRAFMINTALVGAAIAVGASALAASSSFAQENNGGDGASQQGKGNMENRKLGKLEVSELGAGCMSISANYGPPADKAQGSVFS